MDVWFGHPDLLLPLGEDQFQRVRADVLDDTLWTDSRHVYLVNCARGQLEKWFSEAKSDFSASGRQIYFHIQGQVLIATSMREIAFVDAFAGRYDTYHFNDIRTWKHTWVDKLEVQSNAWGDKASGHTRRAKNILVITTTNPQKPVYRIHLSGHTQGEIWMARLEALING